MAHIPNIDFGAQVQQWLRDDHLIWVTTVRSDDVPEPTPVWLLVARGL